MNFLFLNSARDWGGNEKWTYLAAKSLAEEHSVYLAYRHQFFGNQFDFRIERFKLPFLFEFDPYTVNRVISIVKKKRIDVLIPTKRKDYVLAGIAAKICKAKNILRLGIVRDLHNRWYNNFVYNLLADGIIVNAEKIRDVLLMSKFIKCDRIRVIYNGLDLDNLKNTVNLNQTKVCSFRVSSMGRITNRKGFDYLIKGFNQFVSLTNAKDVELLIIGDGKQLQALKYLAGTLKLNDKVRFSGFLENPYSHLSISDVFVLLSKNEGISNALLEAMYFKNAIITTAVGGAAEIIEHGKNGYLIDAIDIVRIGELLQDLYSNPEKRKEFGEAAHQTVLKKFSLETMKENIENFCHEII